MSWQAYVDNNLVGSGKLAEAAILSLNDEGVWAISPGFNSKFTLEEQRNLRTAVKAHEKGDLSSVQGSGIRVGGNKFMFTTNTERSFYGIRKADGGNHGIIVVKTNKTFIVAEYAPPIQAAEATPVAEGVADYLISTTY